MIKTAVRREPCRARVAPAPVPFSCLRRWIDAPSTPADIETVPVGAASPDRRTHDTLAQLDTPIRNQFAAVEALIQSKNLPTSIRDRHQAAVTVYKKESKALHGHLKALDETDPAKHKEKVRQARDWLKGMKHQRSHQDYDPNQLPNRNLTPAPGNQPRTTPEAYRSAGLFDTPYLQLAALGDFTYAKLPGAEDPAYLATSDEVTKSPAIQAKAEALGHDPVKIHHWVRNNVEWLPTWGAIQNADLTLSAQRGNAFDIASLTLALLRASGIPARYVHGTVDIPAEQFRNWAGGFDTVEAAADFAASGGIPVTTIVSGGAISKIRLEHIWVEAAIDYVPSRGAKNRDADTWVALDPSYKQYEYTAPIDTATRFPLNADAILGNAVAGATINETLQSITKVDEAYVLAEIGQYANTVQQAISRGEVSEDALFGTKRITARNSPILPSGLPYHVVVTGARHGAVPDQLRHFVRVESFQNKTDRVMGVTDMAYQIPLSKLGEKRLGITFKPSDADSAAIMADAEIGGADTLPLYLIRVDPTLRLDDQDLVLGTSMTMGGDLYLDIVIKSPVETRRLAYTKVAGDEIVVGIGPSGVVKEMLLQRRASYTQSNAAETLHGISLNYWAEADLITRLLGDIKEVRTSRLPSVGLFTSKLTAVYMFGIAREGYYLNWNIDLKHIVHAYANKKGGKTNSFVSLVGLLHSYLEGSILEQTIYNWQGTSLSTVQALLDANRQGIPIYRITQQNSAAVLPLLTLGNGDVMTDIRNALAAGQEVIVPQSIPAKEVGTTGFGYILQDPETGGAAYRISGGLGGSDAGAPCGEKERKPKTAALHDIVASLIVAAFIALILAGIIIGTGGPGGAVVLANISAIMVGFGLTAFTQPATAGDTCKPVRSSRGRNKDIIHDQCADLVPPNEFAGFDACVAGVGFDAISNGLTTLWEVKTENYKNAGADFIRNAVISKWISIINDHVQIIKGVCAGRFSYSFLIGDPRYIESFDEKIIFNGSTRPDRIVSGPSFCTSVDQ